MLSNDVDYTKFARRCVLKSHKNPFISVFDDSLEKGNPLRKKIDETHHDYETGGVFQPRNIKWHDKYFLDYWIYIPKFDPDQEHLRTKLLELEKKGLEFDKLKRYLDESKIKCVMVNNDNFFIASQLPHLLKSNNIQMVQLCKDNDTAK